MARYTFVKTVEFEAASSKEAAAIAEMLATQAEAVSHDSIVCDRTETTDENFEIV